MKLTLEQKLKLLQDFRESRMAQTQDYILSVGLDELNDSFAKRKRFVKRYKELWEPVKSVNSALKLIEDLLDSEIALHQLQK